MRSRIALLLATVVLFAPAWNGHGTAHHSRGNDLDQGALAPGANEGTVRGAVAHEKPQLGGRQTKRWRSGLTMATLVAPALGGMALALFSVLTLHPGSLFGLFRLRFRFSRAPPRLQPA